MVTFPLRTRFTCQAEWAFCTQSFTWYKTTMLESKRHAGTSQTIKINDLDSLFVLSQCPLGPVYMKVGDPK